MKKILVLICYNLGLWGILGFFATLFLGFLSCCANLSENVFYGFLIGFAVLGIAATTICVSRGCKKAMNQDSWFQPIFSIKSCLFSLFTGLNHALIGGISGINQTRSFLKNSSHKFIFHGNYFFNSMSQLTQFPDPYFNFRITL